MYEYTDGARIDTLGRPRARATPRRLRRASSSLDMRAATTLNAPAITLRVARARRPATTPRSSSTNARARANVAPVRRASAKMTTPVGRVTSTRRRRARASASASAERTMEERMEGRATYAPESYTAMCVDAYASLRDALNDGKKLIEVEFPAIPGEDADYKAASDVYIDANMQYALLLAQKLNSEMGKNVDVLVPDGIEYRRAKKILENALDLSDSGVRLNVLDGRKGSMFGSAFGDFMGNKGLRSRQEAEEDDDFDSADVFIAVNLSTIELESLETFAKEKANGRPLVAMNLQLDTLRADLGLFSFPERDLHYRFLSRFTPAFYLRTRAYSRTINVSPFVINYSGAIFREYPAPWQVMIKQNNGILACVAENEDRFTLAEAKEEMLIALGINDPDDSPMKKLRSGYKTSTWWEEDCPDEQSDAWRT